jgi:putative endonuclease
METNRQKGRLGEDIACLFLLKNDYTVVEKNYLKKWGEIDIVAQKKNKLHFIEVKSSTRKYVKNDQKSYRPEENVSVLKRARMRRVIQTYLSERKHGINAEFYFHIIVVHMNMDSRRAHVSMIENVIL